MGKFAALPIRKAVIPAAGLGTRMLPVTKVLPKEMIPIANKPLIQYAVEEAVSSGIEEIVLITHGRKSVLERYFRRDSDLEQLLIQRGRYAELESIRALSSLAHFRIVCQDSARGLGDALLCARGVLGNEAFAVLLPDVIFDSQRPVLAQLLAAFDEYPGYYVAAGEVEAMDVPRFGMLAVEQISSESSTQRLFRVLSLVEKPSPDRAPSRYGVFGRYLLSAGIFDFLDKLTPSADGEIQLTDALGLCCQSEPFYALCLEGTHYDAGNKLGYVQATVDFALKDPEVAPALRRYLENLAITQYATASK
jgi:UTP--glucose-1-phosphate uridylyltransferase